MCVRQVYVCVREEVYMCVWVVVRVCERGMRVWEEVYVCVWVVVRVCV